MNNIVLFPEIALISLQLENYLFYVLVFKFIHKRDLLFNLLTHINLLNYHYFSLYCYIHMFINYLRLIQNYPLIFILNFSYLFMI